MYRYFSVFLKRQKRYWVQDGLKILQQLLNNRYCYRGKTKRTVSVLILEPGIWGEQLEDEPSEIKKTEINKVISVSWDPWINLALIESTKFLCHLPVGQVFLQGLEHLDFLSNPESGSNIGVKVLHIILEQ